MRSIGSWLLSFVLLLAAAAWGQVPRVAVLVDLDPQRVDRSTAIESITADAQGRLYVPDNVSGNIFRVDPNAPVPVIVGRIARRPAQSEAASNGLAFNRAGDLFIAKGAFNEVLRIRRSDLNPDRPGLAETFAAGTDAPNGVVVAANGTLFVSGPATGNIYFIRPTGGRAAVAFHRDGFRPNGLAIDARGFLYMTETAAGQVWKAAIGPDGHLSQPTLFAKSPLLERIDGIAFDASGTLWGAVQRNAIVTVSSDGTVRDVAHNDGDGPLEAPTAIVFVGSRAYVNNHDTVAPPNGDGKTSERGVGASIAVIEP